MKIEIQKEWYRSKKLWMATVTLLAIVATVVFDIDVPLEKVLAMAALALGYIFAQGKEDAAVKGAAAAKL